MAATPTSLFASYKRALTSSPNTASILIDRARKMSALDPAQYGPVYQNMLAAQVANAQTNAANQAQVSGLGFHSMTADQLVSSLKNLPSILAKATGAAASTPQNQAIQKDLLAAIAANPQAAQQVAQIQAAGSKGGLSGFLNQHGQTIATLAAAALAGPALYGAMTGAAGGAAAGTGAAGGTAGGLSGGATAVSPDVASFLASTPVQAGASAGNAMAGLGTALPAGSSVAGMGNMLGAASLGNTASIALPAMGGSGAAGAAGAAGGATMGSNIFMDVLGQVAGPAISGLFGGSAASQQASAAQQAAGLTAAASDKATALQREMWQQQQAQQQPWLAAGTNALAQMQQGMQPGGAYEKPFSMADYQADPGYAFRLKEGMKGLEQGAAARGGVLSGNMLRGAQQYGQDMASQEYQGAYNRYQQQQGQNWNRLAGLAGVGQSAVSQLGSMGSQYAGNVGNIGMGSAANQANAALMAGQARASSMQGMGQALGGVNWGQVGKSVFG